MTVSSWGSWLIAAFTFKHSAGTATALSMWVSGTQPIGVLDSLYSADAGYIVTKNEPGDRESSDAEKNKHPDISFAH